MSVTADDLSAARWTLRMHMRLGRGGFVRMGECVQWPRLTVRKGRDTFREPITSRFYVDGIECTTREAIAERLNAPAPAAKAAS